MREKSLDMFTRSALLIGHSNRGWGIYDVMSEWKYDDGSTMLELVALTENVQGSVDAGEARIGFAVHSHWAVPMHRVVAMVTLEQRAWLHEQLTAAYEEYLAVGSEAAWDCFCVKAHLFASA